MPFGIDKKIGGDNQANVKYIEECVRSIMSKNPRFDKGTAIAICKKNLKEKRKRNQ